MCTMKMDQLNCTLSLDNSAAAQLQNLAPHKSTFDFNAPRQVSSNLSMPKPVVSTISSWVHSLEIPDPVKLAKMEALGLFV